MKWPLLEEAKHKLMCDDCHNNKPCYSYVTGKDKTWKLVTRYDFYTSSMSKHGDDWKHDLMDWVDMVNKTNNKTRKWIDGKLEVVCPACKAIAEHKVFTTFEYWYCNTCKAEV